MRRRSRAMLRHAGDSASRRRGTLSSKLAVGHCNYLERPAVGSTIASLAAMMGPSASLSKEGWQTTVRTGGADVLIAVNMEVPAY